MCILRLSLSDNNGLSAITPSKRWVSVFQSLFGFLRGTLLKFNSSKRSLLHELVSGFSFTGQVCEWYSVTKSEWESRWGCLFQKRWFNFALLWQQRHNGCIHYGGESGKGGRVSVWAQALSLQERLHKAKALNNSWPCVLIYVLNNPSRNSLLSIQRVLALQSTHFCPGRNL